MRKLKIYFSDFFGVDRTVVDSYGAFDISLVGDLPLFIDPFLLFNSEIPDYRDLHEKIIEYVVYLKDISKSGVDAGLTKALFHFPEIKQNWMGYSLSGNEGRGLGAKFARSLKSGFSGVISNFGEEKGISPHLEKLTLVKAGIGRDQISDLTCNLISGYLAEYTQGFADKYIEPSKIGRFPVKHADFNYVTGTWATKYYRLPKYNGDFVLLVPKDLLTKDESWISHKGLVEDFSGVVSSISNDQLRSQVSSYFASVTPTDPTIEERRKAIEKVVERHPEVVDAYIKLKELCSSSASAHGAERVADAQTLFIEKIHKFFDLLCETEFYDTPTSSRDDAIKRVNYLKNVIEAQDGYRLLQLRGKNIRRESDAQLMFKLTWFASPFDYNSEVNNGRGPADFVVSYGAADKTVIEFKLGSNSQLEKNIKNQAEIYGLAARATNPPIKVIIYFDDRQLDKITKYLKLYGLSGCEDIILIDASPDKPSASKSGVLF